MKRSGSVAPAGAFTVNQLWNGLVEIRFYENVQMVTRELDDGTEITEWEYNEIIIRRPYFDGLEDAIEANYDVWLAQAKAEEEAMNPEDAHQLRADVDFLQICLDSMGGVAVMPLESPATDPAILEKVRKYYPARWDKDRLKRLVYLQQLMQEDYKTITGEDFSA